MIFGYPIAEIERLGFSIKALDLTVKASSRSAQEIIRTPVLPPNATYITQSDAVAAREQILEGDRKSTRLNSSHVAISYAVFCLKKKNYNMVCIGWDDSLQSHLDGADCRST